MVPRACLYHSNIDILLKKAPNFGGEFTECCERQHELTVFI